MPDLVNIPLASAQYQARFARPYLGFIGEDRPRTVRAVVDALLPFDFHLANAEVITTGNLSEHKVIFKIPERRISLEFGAEGYRFTKDDSSWSTATEDGEVLAAVERALLEGSEVKVVKSTLILAMHLQVLARPREEVLAPYFPERLQALLKEQRVETHGTHLKWANGDLLLDFSAVFANGIFVRLSFEFAGHPPLEEILTKAREDESALFEILGVEETANA